MNYFKRLCRILFAVIMNLFLLVTLSASPALSQDLTITLNTTLEPGEYTFNNVIVTNNATLIFNGAVTLNANNLTIDSGASISADGKGFAGGSGSSNGQGPGGGVYGGGNAGAGAGYGGKGGDDAQGHAGGEAYGSSSQPTDLGSGGGGSFNGNGGAGGGAILLNVSGTLTMNGSITANGEDGVAGNTIDAGGGSGGSVYIIVTILQGNGAITANGGSGDTHGGGGAGGRIAIDSQTSTFTGLITALGGSGFQFGEAGSGPPTDADDVRIAAGPNSPQNFINSFNESNLTVEVDLSSFSENTDDVQIILNDGLNNVAANTSGTDGSGTVILTGIDGSSLDDGPISIDVTITNSLGPTTKNFTGFQKDTRVFEGLHAYVVSGDGTVSVIDVNTRSIVQVINVGNTNIRTIEPSPDNTRVYVYAGFGTIYVIDTQNNLVIGSIATTAIAGGSMILTPDGLFLYVSDNFSGRLVKVDTEAFSEISLDPGGGLPIGGGPFDIVISPDGSRAFVVHGFSSSSSAQDGNNVSVIDLNSDTKIQNIVTAKRNQGIAMHPSGNFVFVTNGGTATTARSESHTVYSINANTYAVSTNILSRGSTKIVVNPAGDRAFVIDDFAIAGHPENDGVISWVPFTNFHVSGEFPNTPDPFPPYSSLSIPSGSHPRLDITTEGDFMFVTNVDQNSISAINFPFASTIQNIPSPKDVAFVTIPPSNLPPSAQAGGPYTANEGGTITFNGSASSDPDMDDLEYRWDFENDGVFDTPFGNVATADKTFGDNSAGQALLEVRDVPGGLSATDLANFDVANLDPSVAVDGPVFPRTEFTLPGETIQFTGHFTDPGWEDTHTANWNFGDSNTDPGTLSNLENAPPDATGDASSEHAYDNSGMYTVRVTITDDDNGSGFAEVDVEVASGEEVAQAIDDAIQDLDNSVFKKPANNRKNAFHNKLVEVKALITAGDYAEAIAKLQNDIRAKADGCLGGNPKNDWVLDCDAQTQITEFIDALVAYLETLQSGLPKTTFSRTQESIPEDFALLQNYPNPFNPETEIHFQLPEASHVVVRVFDILGKQVRTLVDAQYAHGYHSVLWDGKDDVGNPVSSGIYLYQLQSGKFSNVKKMNLLR